MALPRPAAIPVLLAACASLAACAVAPELPPVQPYDAAALAQTQYKAVLVAGDGSLPVWDNAVRDVAASLGAHGGPSGASVRRLSASPAVVAQDGVRSATLDHVLDAVSGMKPGPGGGCLVFATSHGAPFQGLQLAAAGREILSPASLDRALARGCGNAPTVVVVSGCYTGSFALAPMARDNRVILTASRPDRPSFGCGAGETYTYYDRCLMGALDAGGTWVQVHEATKQCVTELEARTRMRPSEPQAWFGPAVAGITVPGRRAL